MLVAVVSGCAGNNDSELQSAKTSAGNGDNSVQQDALPDLGEEVLGLAGQKGLLSPKVSQQATPPPSKNANRSFLRARCLVVATRGWRPKDGVQSEFFLEQTRGAAHHDRMESKSDCAETCDKIGATGAEHRACYWGSLVLRAHPVGKCTVSTNGSVSEATSTLGECEDECYGMDKKCKWESKQNKKYVVAGKRCFHNYKDCSYGQTQKPAVNIPSCEAGDTLIKMAYIKPRCCGGCEIIIGQHWCDQLNAICAPAKK